MGFFNKLFKGPEIDREKSDANAEKMRVLFNQVVEGGDDYRLIFGYTAFQLRICSWKQNENWEFDCRLERDWSDDHSRTHRPRSFRLWRPDLLPSFCNL